MKTTVKHTMHGVEGQLTTDHYSQIGRRGIFCFSKQVFQASRMFKEDGASKKIIVNVRHDDECSNGHNSFAITATIWSSKVRGDCESCGCLHEEIAKHFPELAHLIQWHLVDTDGPMHYFANALYFAGDLDYNGKRKGEPLAWDDTVYFGNSPMPTRIKSKAFLAWVKARLEFLTNPAVLTTNPDFSLFEAIVIPHKDKGKPGVHQYSDQFSLVGYEKGKDWTFAPFADEIESSAWVEALNLHIKSVRKGLPGFVRFDRVPTRFSEGKERELEKARSSAHWPEVTDEQLCLPRHELKALLDARLPDLTTRFKAAVEEAGFQYQVEGFDRGLAEWEKARDEKKA